MNQNDTDMLAAWIGKEVGDGRATLLLVGSLSHRLSLHLGPDFDAGHFANEVAQAIVGPGPLGEDEE